MRIDRYKVNIESAESDVSLDEAYARASKEVEVSGAVEPTEDTDVSSVNPIEADQAIEIANSPKTTVDDIASVGYQGVLDAKEVIEENTVDVNNKLELLNKVATSEDVHVTAESMKMLYSIYNIQPINISKEDIDNNPEAVGNILANEQQVIQAKANEQVWSTITEDIDSIIKLIDSGLESIKALDGLKNDILVGLDDIKVLPMEQYDLTSMLDIIGGYRYITAKHNDLGMLDNLLVHLGHMLTTRTPKLTNEDNKVILDLNGNKPDALDNAINYVKSAIETDAMNVYLRQASKTKGNIEDYNCIVSMSGKDNIKVLSDGNVTNVGVGEQYSSFLYNPGSVNLDLLKSSLKETIENTEPIYGGIFINIYKKKYEVLKDSLKPLSVIAEQQHNVKLKEALNLIRFYYIDFVKDRIVDRVNAYHSYLKICKLLIEKGNPKLAKKQEVEYKNVDNTDNKGEDDGSSSK